MSGMTVYFTRRLLLVPITFLAITFMVYAILRVVPGGPIEQAETMMKLAAASGEGGGGGAGGLGDESGLQLDEGAMRELEEYYALDRSIAVGYLQWLGAWPRVKKTRVPVVPTEKHQEAAEALTAAAEALQAAETALDEGLAASGWKAWDGRLWEPVPEADVPEDVQTRTKDLLVRSFGDLAPVQTFLAGHELAWVEGGYAKAVAEPGEEARRLLEAEVAAKARVAQVEQETGYFLDERGRLVQLAFRPILALNDIREEVTQRIQDLLGPEDMIAFHGHVYRKLTDAELDAFRKTELYQDAEDMVDAGFGKRDELYETLKEAGYTWRANKYYVRLTEAEHAAKKDLLDTADALVATRLLVNEKLSKLEDEDGYEITAGGRLYKLDTGFSGVLQLDFGRSYTYGKDVLSLIGSKMEVSIQFGLIGYFLTWIVCVPLGVFKAIKHRSLFDSATSVLVFLGYSIPGFILCLILLSTLAVHVDWIPLGGYKPDNIEQMGYFEAVWGRIRHMLIPVAGYMIGGFAAMTILMKNSLLENLGQDYVRTAFAKGLREKRVIFVHALRNSLIPITAGIGHALGLLFAGSFLIEKTCNIDGMGLLGFEAVLGRDYPIILGLLVFLVLIRLFGNILSDIIWALIDPRIRFG